LIGVSEAALGECLTSQKRFAEAEPLLKRSYVTINSVQGEKGPSRLEAARRLATLSILAQAAKNAELALEPTALLRRNNIPAVR